MGTNSPPRRSRLHHRRWLRPGTVYSVAARPLPRYSASPPISRNGAAALAGRFRFPPSVSEVIQFRLIVTAENRNTLLPFDQLTEPELVVEALLMIDLHHSLIEANTGGSVRVV